MIILGIDPGLATVGWGVIRAEGGKLKPVAYGTVRTPADMSTEKGWEASTATPDF